MSEDISNPYMDNRRDWNEIYGKEKVNASMWRNFGLLNMFITLVAVLGMIYAAQLPDVVPFLFKEDASGGITALGIPNKIMQVDNQIIANQLAIYIEALRQVPIVNEDDKNTMRKNNVRRVKMMSTDSLFNNKLAPMFKTEYAATDGLDIEIKTILPISKNTWQVDWVELKHSIPTGRYKAIISYTRIKNYTSSPEVLIWNPLGITVQDININQVIGS